MEKATTQYDTCMLHDPHGDPAITYELDDRFTDRCGFIVRKVTPTDNGKWEIIYGRKIVYKAEVHLNVQGKFNDTTTKVDDGFFLGYLGIK